MPPDPHTAVACCTHASLYKPRWGCKKLYSVTKHAAKKSDEPVVTSPSKVVSKTSQLWMPSRHIQHLLLLLLQVPRDLGIHCGCQLVHTACTSGPPGTHRPETSRPPWACPPARLPPAPAPPHAAPHSWQLFPAPRPTSLVPSSTAQTAPLGPAPSTPSSPRRSGIASSHPTLSGGHCGTTCTRAAQGAHSPPPSPAPAPSRCTLRAHLRRPPAASPCHTQARGQRYHRHGTAQWLAC